MNVEAPADSDRGWRVLAPFRVREYRLLIAAVSLAIFAEGMWTVVMALQTIALDGDPAALSLVASAMATGLVACVLVGGLVADRVDQRSVIIGVQVVDLIATATVAVLGATGTLRIWHMVVAAALLGIGAAFFFPAYGAMLPRILEPGQLLAANGVEGVLRPMLARAVGPAVAGMLIGATFPALGAGCVAGLFGAGLVILIATRRPSAPAVIAPAERAHVLRDLRDGLRFVVRTPWLSSTLLFASMFVLVVLGPIEVLLPFIARDRFADGPQAYGLLLASYGVGSAAGALVVSSGRMPRRYLTTMMIAWGAGSLPLLAVGTTSSFPLMAASTFVVGVTDGTGMVIWGTLLQRRVPTHMLGRVSSLDFFVSLAFMPVSFAIVGPLSKVVSMPVIFAVAALAPPLFAVLAYVLARMGRDEIAHPLH